MFPLKYNVPFFFLCYTCSKKGSPLTITYSVRLTQYDLTAVLLSFNRKIDQADTYDLACFRILVIP